MTDTPDIEERNTTSDPTPEEDAAAERAADNAPDVEDEYRDMTDKGAHAKGEGAID